MFYFIYLFININDPRRRGKCITGCVSMFIRPIITREYEDKLMSSLNDSLTP
jgi:hypothetical protein